MLRKLLDEAKSAGLVLDQALDGTLDEVHAAHMAIYKALDAGCLQLGIRKDDQLSNRDFAEATCMAMRHLVTGEQIMARAIYLLAMEAYKDRIWLYYDPPLESFGEWVDFVIPDGGNAYKWKYILTQAVPQILLPLEAQPVEGPNGEIWDHQALIGVDHSKLQELVPVTRNLDVQGDAGRKILVDLVTAAKTGNRKELREKLEAEGYRTPDRKIQWFDKRQHKEVDHSTGVVQIVTLYQLRITHDADAVWLERQLYPRFRFTTPAPKKKSAAGGKSGKGKKDEQKVPMAKGRRTGRQAKKS